MARYWFRRKSFGYGATPATWQGWALTLAVLLLLAGLVYAAPHIRSNGLRAATLAIGIPLVLVSFIGAAHTKTENGWRWRSGQ